MKPNQKSKIFYPVFNAPLISVITVVFNAEDLIEDTVKSILEQTYPNIEYIIIDGGSTDGTVRKVNRFRHKLKYFVSEADKGIYDAMNKGILAAKGDWIIFINAGDYFFSNDTVSQAVKKMDRSSDIFFGGVEIDYAKFSRFEFPGSPRNLWRGMQFSHQSVFVKLSYHQKNLYNINNKITADLEFLYTAYSNKIKFKKINLIISRVTIGGISESSRYKTIKSSCGAICGKEIKPLIRFFYLLLLLSLIFKKFMKFILPEILIQKIILSKSNNKS